MTINVAVATFDAIVLGCDSLSSASEPVVRYTGNYAIDADGNEIVDAQGRRVIAADTISSVVTTVFGGVDKMFLLYEGADISVAAVTSGQASLNGLPIAEVAKRFRRDVQNRPIDTVEAVAQSFLTFVRAEWIRHTDFENVPPEMRQYLPALNFLVGGFGPGAVEGRVFSLEVSTDRSTVMFADNLHHCGICWAGQANFVERLVNGAELGMTFSINRRYVEAQVEQRDSLLREVGAALVEAGIDIPEGFEFNLTEPAHPSLPWNLGYTDIDYPNLPVQYAVDLAEMLVNTQSGMQRFARGVPTVGGRTHIGVLRRGESFEKLNESALEHRHIGYANDI